MDALAADVRGLSCVARSRCHLVREGFQSPYSQSAAVRVQCPHGSLGGIEAALVAAVLVLAYLGLPAPHAGGESYQTLAHNVDEQCPALVVASDACVLASHDLYVCYQLAELQEVTAETSEDPERGVRSEVVEVDVASSAETAADSEVEADLSLSASAKLEAASFEGSAGYVHSAGL